MWKVFFVALRLYGVLPDDEYEQRKMDLAQTYETKEYDYADIVSVPDEHNPSVKLVLWSIDSQGIHRPYVCESIYTNWNVQYNLSRIPVVLDEETVQVYDPYVSYCIDQRCDNWTSVGVYRRFKVKEIRYWYYPSNKWKTPQSGLVVAGGYRAINRDDIKWTKEHEELYKQAPINEP
jgi:hypothetical protein